MIKVENIIGVGFLYKDMHIHPAWDGYIEDILDEFSKRLRELETETLETFSDVEEFLSFWDALNLLHIIEKEICK